MITDVPSRKRGRPRKTSLSSEEMCHSPSFVPEERPALDANIGISPQKKSSKVKAVYAEAQPIIVIDYPKNEEKIHPHHYGIRLGATGGDSVEISIDNGDWQPCRQSAGYFWYDWHSIPSGNHKIVARIKLPGGKYKKSGIIRCKAD